MTPTELGLGFLAGILSVLSPCILPLLPVVLTGAAHQGRGGPLALAGGLSLSFSGIGLFLATVGLGLGLDDEMSRQLAAGLMMIFGVFSLYPALSGRLVARLSGLGWGLPAYLPRVSGRGWGGQFCLGLLLGLTWSPCAGPALGAAFSVAGQGGWTLLKSGTVMLAFGLGAVLPLLGIAYGLQRSHFQVLARWGRPALGGALLVIGGLVISGFDKRLESLSLTVLPAWWIDLATRF